MASKNLGSTFLGSNISGEGCAEKEVLVWDALKWWNFKLTNGLNVSETGFTGSGTQKPDSLVNTPKWWNVNSLTTDSTGTTWNFQINSTLDSKNCIIAYIYDIFAWNSEKLETLFTIKMVWVVHGSYSSWFTSKNSKNLGISQNFV